MLKVPAPNEFPGTGRQGNGIAETMKSQPEWVNQIKTTGCMSCHALGTEGTRTISKSLGEFKNSAEAWARRIASGQAMTQMINAAARVGPERGLALWADWTDRIAAGELPFAQPQRPQGIERKLVLTLWDWSRPTAYMHDLISTDRRKPTVNANGRLYGAPENSTDLWPVLDPMRHVATEVKHPVRDPNTPSHRTDPMAPSPYWGEQPIWDSQTSTHNQMMDERGRVWAAARIRQRTRLVRRLLPVRARRADRERRAPSLDVRPGERQVDAHLYLLPDASPHLRRGRRRNDLDFQRRRWRRGPRLAQAARP
jgi:hypothetical protein